MFGEKKENRFVKIVYEGFDKKFTGSIFVFVDTETGVQYVQFSGEGRGGATVLVDRTITEDKSKKAAAGRRLPFCWKESMR